MKNEFCAKVRTEIQKLDNFTVTLIFELLQHLNLENLQNSKVMANHLDHRDGYVGLLKLLVMIGHDLDTITQKELETIKVLSQSQASVSV